MSGEVGLWQHPVTKRWYITWTERGRSYRNSTGETDRRKAERARAAFVLTRDQKSAAKPDEVMVATLLDDYWEQHASKLPSAERARVAIKHLAEFYGVATVSSVTPRTNDRYIAQCRQEGKAEGTINQHLNRLRAALRRGVKTGVLTNAPSVPMLKEADPRAHVLDRKQVADLLRACRRLDQQDGANSSHDHIALFIRLAVYTGARRSALLQLTWDRIDFRTGTADFRLPGVAQTRKRRAIAALPSKLLRSLQRLRARSTGDRVITFAGRPIASIKHAFTKVARAAGLPHVTPHVLKHTAVSWALRVASPWVVSGQTATSIRTLQSVYGKHMVADQRTAVEAVGHLRIVTRKLRANSAKRRSPNKRVNGGKKPLE